MSPVIGYATMPVIPSLKGMEREIKQQLGGVDAAGRSAGQSAGRGFSSRFVDGLSGVASAMGRVITGAATAAGVAGGGVLAASLTKGMGRLTAIDDAQGKLRGLGHDTQSVAQIMESALDSVRGTAYGLGDAATVSATAVAAGIEPGAELTRYLKLIADTSTIAGVGLNEVGAILNKTTTSGRVFTMELNQLADRGLPVFQWLQDEYGVSAEALRDMVSAGQVDAETFRRVIEENIGGAALEAGQTFRGAWANVGAAMGRMGAEILTPFFEASKTVAPALIAVFDELSSRITPAITGLAESPGFQRLVDWFAELPDKIGPIVGQLSGFGSALAPLAAGIGALGLGSIAGALGPLGALIPTLNPLVAIFGTVIAMNPELRELFVQTLGQAIEALRPALPPLVEAFSAIAGAVGELLIALLPVIPPLASLIGFLVGTVIAPVVIALADGVAAFARALQGLGPLISEVSDAFNEGGLGAALALIGQRISEAWPAIRSALAEMAKKIGAQVAEWGKALIGWIGPRIGPMLKELGRLVGQAANWLISSGLPMLVDGIVKWGNALVDWVKPRIVPMMREIAKIIPPLLVELGKILVAITRWLATTAVPKLLEAAGRLAWALTQWVLGLGVEIVKGLASGLVEIGRWIVAEGVPRLVTNGAEMLAGLLSGVVSAASDLWDWFLALPGEILELLGDAVTWLVDSGWNVLKGLYDGIGNFAATLWQWFIDLPGSIKDYFVDALTWLLQAGTDIITGLFDGIGSFATTVAMWLLELPGVIKGYFFDAAEWLVQAGKDIVEGLYNGIINAPHDIAEALAEKSGIPGISGLIRTSKRGWDFMRNPLGRAMGGPVSAGTPYIVGEIGPELFVPNQSGTIVPNHELGRGNVTVNLNATYTDPNPMEWVARSEFLAGVGG